MLIHDGSLWFLPFSHLIMFSHLCFPGFRQCSNLHGILDILSSEEPQKSKPLELLPLSFNCFMPRLNLSSRLRFRPWDAVTSSILTGWRGITAGTAVAPTSVVSCVIASTVAALAAWALAFCRLAARAAFLASSFAAACFFCATVRNPVVPGTAPSRRGIRRCFGSQRRRRWRQKSQEYWTKRLAVFDSLTSDLGICTSVDQPPRWQQITWHIIWYKKVVFCNGSQTNTN